MSPARRSAGPTSRAAVVILAALMILTARADALGAELEASDRQSVGLVGPERERLTRQLRRELTASGFAVVIDSSLASPVLQPLTRTVVVDLAAKRVRLLSRAAPGEPLVDRASFPVNPADGVSIRRAALALVERLRLETAAPAPPVAAAPAEPATPSPTPTAIPTAESTVSEPEPPPLRSARPWSLGASPTLDLAPGHGEATSHVQITGETALGTRVRGTVRALWPLLGARRSPGDRSVRMWTSGIAAGARLPLRGQVAASATPAFQPFVGAAAGMRLVLADTDWVEHRHGDVSLTPAVVTSASTGVRQRILPLVHLLFEVTGEWSRTLPGASPESHERELADATVVRVGLGVSFDY